MKAVMINLDELKAFLKKADMPHATGTAEIKHEADGSRTITFEEGRWSMHDNFFGGEPYGGRQVVFYKGEPVWLCVYYGRVTNTEPAPEIYDFLRDSLANPDEASLHRGPSSYKKNEMRYKNKSKGNVDNFSGHEVITRDSVQIYEATYLGGLIDQRAKGSL